MNNKQEVKAKNLDKLVAVYGKRVIAAYSNYPTPLQDKCFSEIIACLELLDIYVSCGAFEATRNIDKNKSNVLFLPRIGVGDIDEYRLLHALNQLRKDDIKNEEYTAAVDEIYNKNLTVTNRLCELIHEFNTGHKAPAHARLVVQIDEYNEGYLTLSGSFHRHKLSEKLQEDWFEDFSLELKYFHDFLIAKVLEVRSNAFILNKIEKL